MSMIIAASLSVLDADRTRRMRRPRSVYEVVRTVSSALLSSCSSLSWSVLQQKVGVRAHLTPADPTYLPTRAHHSGHVRSRASEDLQNGLEKAGRCNLRSARDIAVPQLPG